MWMNGTRLVNLVLIHQKIYNTTKSEFNNCDVLTNIQGLLQVSVVLK